MTTTPEVRSRLLKSESPIDRVYDVDFTDKTTAVEIETLDAETGATIAARYQFGDGRVIPINDLPTYRPVPLHERFAALPWWAHATWGAGAVEALHLIVRHL